MSKKKAEASGKSVDEQIADIEKQIEELRAKQRELANPIQEFPKWLPDFGVTVENAEQEKNLRSKKAAVEVVKAASGDIRTVGKPAKPAVKKAGRK